ncbi:MAG TPA: hypothetical protein DHV36_10435 [Desulfobacteraceae bacterium]|nr:hypothetical protein [Desulfobacteraceae bacterium]
MSPNNPASPFIGIIMLDTIFPRIPGDIGHPDTFTFPIRYSVVKDASPERLVIKADKTLLAPFVEAGQGLIRDGACAIATSCGFLALFHRELTRALDVPVFSSSLLQVHTAASVIQPGQKIGILTARKASLTHDHLAGVGIENYPLAIQGMDDSEEFTSVFIHGKKTLDTDQCQKEINRAVAALMAATPDLGALVLECTNMPPYTPALKEITGTMPVYDSTTLLNTVWDSIVSSPRI